MSSEISGSVFMLKAEHESILGNFEFLIVCQLNWKVYKRISISVAFVTPVNFPLVWVLPVV